MRNSVFLALIAAYPGAALAAPANFNCISTLGSRDDATLAISASLVSGVIVSSTRISDPKIVDIEAFEGRTESKLSPIAFNVAKDLKKLTMKLSREFSSGATGEITIEATGPGTGALVGTQVVKARGRILSDRRVFCDVIVNDGWDR